ncbi:MAG: prepilin-type N-terminal cleavage/methylation domain-containing protein [Myxococcales bacterium]|nr:prepilin-type N-terminal cleavage/methylation domain-containing protein [Myxococcales bacterium]MCB9524968.1 prepilin-type N-terminal cleavage/methylation domain-containing protein [Myxococcales bacterium]
MRNRSRGMTLIELMIVVVIVGVLSVLAVTGYRRFTLQARNAEAQNFLGVIRAAQQAYYEGFGQFCGADGWENHPAQVPLEQKVNWGQPAGAWRDLGVKSPGQVWFRYRMRAGADNPPEDHFPAGPWFVAQANGDWDRDGRLSTYEVSSATNTVFIDNENE